MDTLIADFAGHQHGFVTFAQLLAAGLTDSAVCKRAARGLLYRKHRGIYSVGHPAASREGLWMAAVLGAGDGAALSGCSAAELHGISRFRASVIDVIAPRLRSLEGVRVHRCRTLDPRDVTTWRHIPVTTVHRALVDLTDVHTPHQLANVIHEAAFRGRFVESATRDAMQRANGRHNLDVLERAIALHKAGSAGTKSGAEDVLLALLSFAEPLVNTELHGHEVDFHWPDRGLVVEVDGPGHGRPGARRGDARRDALLRAVGYEILRFSDGDVRFRPDEVLNAIRTRV